jgi:glutaredoxin
MKTRPQKAAQPSLPRRRSNGVWVGALLIGALSAVACKGSKPGPDGKHDPTGTTPETRELPKLVIRDDSPNLLLTWLDSEGDFHVVQKPADVPVDARNQVRVVVTTEEAGTNDLVYVANLTTPNPDGSYPTRTLSRAEWNNLGADRRKVRLEALAPSLVTATPGAASGSPAGGKPGAESASADYSKVHVIIYGAVWCKPCHDAEKFVRSLGASVVKKDIEESRAAQAEMQLKLAQAGRMGSSIPVIDVAGKLLIGFSEEALRSAVKAAAGAETL